METSNGQTTLDITLNLFFRKWSLFQSAVMLHAHAELDRLVRRRRYADRKQVGQLPGVPGHERDVPRRPRSVSVRTTREDALVEHFFATFSTVLTNTARRAVPRR